MSFNPARGGGPRDGVVSVVLLSSGDTPSLRNALEALARCEWPPDDLEVVVVDDTRARGNAAAGLPLHPRVVAGRDASAAAARNRGARAATGEWLAFLGPAHRPDPGWVTEAVAAMQLDSTVACVASSVAAPDDGDGWNPTVAFTGHPSRGAACGSAESGPRDVLYASADAMVIRRDAFHDVGGFDERFERLLDDVDLGWRLWLFGHRVRYVPASSVVRTSHAPVPSPEERAQRDRNALVTIFKNYDDASLAAVLPTALIVGVHQATEEAGGMEEADLAASARAIDGFARALPELVAERRRIQERRVRTDPELAGLLTLPMASVGDGEDPPDPVSAAAMEALGVAARFGRRRRIVVATCDTLTPKMAGPAIRAWHMAQALAAEHEVQLVTTSVASVSHPLFPVRLVDDRALAELERWCDVLIFQGWLLSRRPFLRSSSKVLVADIYDPMHLEQLEQSRDEGHVERRAAVRRTTEVLNEQLMRGDFFLCASLKQRDFWLGQMAALGRINPRTYDEDATLASLIAVVPFGTPDAPPVHTRPTIKGVVPGIGPDDKVILWGGGIYNWFDPLTLLRAVDRLRRRQPNARLLFMGLRHPNPGIPTMSMAVATRALAQKLELTGTHVFFNEGWVDYDDRQNYLLEADIGVSTHLDHVETALSSRTRILDYLWASLPVVATEGDGLSDLVVSREAGLAVPAGDVDALEDALFRLLDDDVLAKTCRENAATLAAELTWSRVLAPLLQFCRTPRRAPDLLDPETVARLRHELGPPTELPRWRRDLDAARGHLRDGGPVVLATKALGRLRRRLP